MSIKQAELILNALDDTHNYRQKAQVDVLATDVNQQQKTKPPHKRKEKTYWVDIFSQFSLGHCGTGGQQPGERPPSV